MPASRAASARDSPSNAPAIACRRAAAARSFSRRASRRNSAAGTSSRIGRPFAPIASSPAGLDATRITSPRVASNHVRVRKSAYRYEELAARYRAARHATEARHYQAIWLLAQGRTVLDAAEVLAVVPRWVEELAARYNSFGPAARGDGRRRNGRSASLLTPDLLAALAERLREPPEDGGVWSGPKVAAWMARRRGLAKVHPQRGWEALKRLEWSVQTPRPRHPRAATSEGREALKKVGRSGRASGGRASGPAGRGLGRRRAPSGPEAGPAPGLGARGRAAGRARPPPLPVAPCRRLRARDRRGPLAQHRPRARQRGLA